MSKSVLAIDVDITTLASDILWWEWLQHITGTFNGSLEQRMQDSLLRGEQVDYNLSTYFSDPINKRVSAFDFWREEGLYNFVRPIGGAVAGITKLAKDFEIVFVTYCKRNHSRSKYNCLERHFGHIPFDYVVTKEKHRVAADLLIDDRNEFINQFLTSNRCAVKLLTPYTQSESLIDTDNLPMRSVYREAKDWDEIVEHIYKIFPF